MTRPLLRDHHPDEWLAVTEAQRRTGIARHGLLMLALGGKIRSEIRAGRVFFAAADVDTVARERSAARASR
jgi:hypothetical protein